MIITMMMMLMMMMKMIIMIYLYKRYFYCHPIAIYNNCKACVK